MRYGSQMKSEREKFLEGLENMRRFDEATKDLGNCPEYYDLYDLYDRMILRANRIRNGHLRLVKPTKGDM